jgi:hypothetical protein
MVTNGHQVPDYLLLKQLGWELEATVSFGAWATNRAWGRRKCGSFYVDVFLNNNNHSNCNHNHHSVYIYI